MINSGHSRDQAIAAALSTARQASAMGGQANAAKIYSGAIHSPVAGRTDHLPMHVASGSYVIPADIISAMGEGNTMAGFKVAKSIFCPSGVTEKATGGPVSSVPIVAAGGEYIVYPNDVINIGGGSLEEGHKTLDEFVKKMRAKTVETLRKLPGPKKD